MVTGEPRKINGHGGAIHIHIERAAVISGITHALYLRATKPRSPLAPIEVRDYVYNSLIRLSPATRYHSALIKGAKGLLARGLDRDRFNRYGGLPAGWEDRERLCRQLLQEISERYHTTDSLVGVPGFWKDAHADFIFGKKPITAPPDCSYQCATCMRVSKPAKCDCLSSRKDVCVTVGSLHQAWDTEPVPAAHCISISIHQTCRTMRLS